MRLAPRRLDSCCATQHPEVISLDRLNILCGDADEFATAGCRRRRHPIRPGAAVWGVWPCAPAAGWGQRLRVPPASTTRQRRRVSEPLLAAGAEDRPAPRRRQGPP